MRLQDITVSEGVLWPPADRVRHLRLIIFVHGSNTPPARAKQVYTDFRKRLARVGVTFQLDTLVELYWPSYVEALVSGERTNQDFVRGMKLLSAVSYPVQLAKAQQVGRALGRYVSQLNGPADTPCEIIFVAHSLGCRVVLEALQDIATHPGAWNGQVSAVCLLAGAVPCYMFEEYGQLRLSASVPEKSCVLFSRTDAILQNFFRVGQTAAAEGFFPVALGTSGEPAERWTTRVDTGLQHGDYIEDRNLNVTPYLARLLGVATLLPVRSRPLTTWQELEPIKLPSIPIREWHISMR